MIRQFLLVYTKRSKTLPSALRLRGFLFTGSPSVEVRDFGSQGCRFESCRVQIKYQSRLAGDWTASDLARKNDYLPKSCHLNSGLSVPDYLNEDPASRLDPAAI